MSQRVCLGDVVRVSSPPVESSFHRHRYVHRRGHDHDRVQVFRQHLTPETFIDGLLSTTVGFGLGLFSKDDSGTLTLAKTMC